ncbi:hypothetical protein D3C73_843300 [compost metagenome]
MTAVFIANEKHGRGDTGFRKGCRVMRGRAADLSDVEAGGRGCGLHFRDDLLRHDADGRTGALAEFETHAAFAFDTSDLFKEKCLETGKH